jgi:hypothetical protein
LSGYDYAKKAEGRIVIAGGRSDESRDAENEGKRD